MCLFVDDVVVDDLSVCVCVCVSEFGVCEFLRNLECEMRVDVSGREMAAAAKPMAEIVFSA